MRPPACGRSISAPQAAPPAGQLQPTGRHLTIHMLPNELLVKIFADTTSTPYGYPSIERGPQLHLFPVMATCRQWREIVSGTPAFWREIAVRRCPEWLTICLQRSQQLPIEVEFFSSTINLSYAWQTLSPHKDRITSLHFRSLQCTHIGPRIALEEMSQLKSLSVRIDHGDNVDEVARHNGSCPLLDITFSHEGELRLTFPRLEEMVLRGLTVTPGPFAGAFSTLRVLGLAGYFGAPRTYGLMHFLNVLQACNSLEILDVNDNALDTIAFDIPQGYPIVALRRLQQLGIVGRVEEVSNLVSHLELGPEVYVWLATDPQEDAGRAALAARAILPFDLQSCRMPILRTANRVKVDLCNGEGHEAMLITAIRGLNPQERINIVLQVAEEPWNSEVGPGSDEAREAYFCYAVHFLPSIFADAPLEELVFSGDIGVVREETWRSLFSSFPRLKTLVLENNTLPEHGDARRVFAALRSQQSPDDPGAVCPLLEYIWVRNTPCEISDLEEVMKFIEWRIARRVPLKRLRLELALFEDEDDTIKAYRTKFGHLVETSILDVEDWALTPNRTTEREFPFGSI